MKGGLGVLKVQDHRSCWQKTTSNLTTFLIVNHEDEPWETLNQSEGKKL
jgi:hypothetical protein